MRVRHLVAMAVALADAPRAIDALCDGAAADLARVGAEAHGAALVDYAVLVGHQIDDRGVAVLVELARVGALHLADVARELHHRELHPQADAEERDLLLARVADGVDLPL